MGTRGLAALWMVVIAAGAACGGTPASPPTAVAPSPTVAEASATPTAVPTLAPTAAATATPVPTPETMVLLTATLATKVTNEERTASGEMRVVFQVERGEYAEVRSATATFQFSLKDLPADARVQFAHIHVGGPTVDGPIVLDAGLTAARFRFTNGAGSIALPAVAVDPKLATDILADPAAFFFMVHSARNPDGFVRGQLRRG